MTDFAVARRHMVDCQLRPNNITDDRLIDAMGTLQRELFLPKTVRGVAYVDEDLPVAPGRYIAEPMVFARLVQAGRITADDAVLDVGCTTGYSTAVLGQLANVVVAVEEHAELAEIATKNLAEAGVDNAAVVTGPLRDGYAAQAPYDVIVLEGAVEDVPQALLDQLGEGGRLLALVSESGVGKARLYTKSGGTVGHRELFDGNMPLLPGFQLETGFAF